MFLITFGFSEPPYYEVQIRWLNQFFFSREVVRTWVTFYKKHREVLGADLVHVKRPNMQVGQEKVYIIKISS